VRTPTAFGPGTFRTRLKAAAAPSSLTGFFLYAPPDYASEVDIEILNDGTRRAILSVWLEGASGHSAEVKLPFDPADGVHRYVIEWRAAEVALFADDSRLARWTTRLPAAPMRAKVNVWWPTWLACTPASGLELVVDGVRIDAKPHRP
jgi:beta-glucanase (GH16 family)